MEHVSDHWDHCLSLGAYWRTDKLYRDSLTYQVSEHFRGSMVCLLIFLTKRKYFAFAVNYKREDLYDRINTRVDEMFSCGLVEEVESLISRGIDEKYQCMQAIGYKEVLFGLKNGDLRSTMCDIIKQNTRRYAKRQITFFKKLPNLVWLNPEDATAERVLELLNEAD